jgi:hypothetical protein
MNLVHFFFHNNFSLLITDLKVELQKSLKWLISVFAYISPLSLIFCTLSSLMPGVENFCQTALQYSKWRAGVLLGQEYGLSAQPASLSQMFTARQ